MIDGVIYTQVGEGTRVLEQSDPQQDDSDGHDADVEPRDEVGVNDDVDEVRDDADEQQEVTDPVENVPVTSHTRCSMVFASVTLTW